MTMAAEIKNRLQTVQNSTPGGQPAININKPPSGKAQSGGCC